MNEIKTNKDPKLIQMLVLGKFDDGQVRQIFTDKRTQEAVLTVMTAMKRGEPIYIDVQPIDAIDWVPTFDLRNK